MPARVFSCAVLGLEGVLIEVEVDTSSGLGYINVVGLPDTAVKESRERIRAAIKNLPTSFPRKSLVINAIAIEDDFCYYVSKVWIHPIAPTSLTGY